MKKVAAALLAAALLAGMTGCGKNADTVCVRETDHVRVDDSQCDRHQGAGTGFLFWYLLASQRAPAYGYPVTVGSPTPPPGYRVYRHRRPATGGTYSKPARPLRPTYRQPPTRTYRAPTRTGRR